MRYFGRSFGVMRMCESNDALVNFKAGSNIGTGGKYHLQDLNSASQRSQGSKKKKSASVSSF